MNALQKGLGWLGAAVLSAVLIVILLVYPVEHIVLNATIVQKAFVQVHLADKLSPWAAELAVTRMRTSAGGTTLDGLLQALDPTQLQTTVAPFVTPEAVQAQLDLLIPRGLAYLNLETPQLSLEYDLSPVKAQLTQESTAALADQIVSTWPECSPEELFKLQSDMAQADGQTVVLVCQPPQEFRPMAVKLVHASLWAAAMNIPDRLDLTAAVKASQTEEQLTRLDKTFESYRNLRVGLDMLPWLALVLFFAILILLFGQWRAMLASLGSGLAVAGTLVLLGSSWMFISGSASELLLRLDSLALPAAVLQAIKDGLSLVFRQAALQGVVLGMMTAGLGLIFLLGCAWLQSRDKVTV